MLWRMVYKRNRGTIKGVEKNMESEYQKYKDLPYHGSKVSIGVSQEDIRKLLSKYGLEAIRFTDLIGMKTSVLEFALRNSDQILSYRFKFNLPEGPRYKKQLYRAVFNYLKARFTSVDFGICTVEEEFMQHLILKLPDGRAGTIQEMYGKKALDLNAGNLQLPFKNGE